MSRYHRFEVDGWRLRLEPVGIRRWWLLRNVPYRTGDMIQFYVRAKPTGKTSVATDEQVVSFTMWPANDPSFIVASVGLPFRELRDKRITLSRVSFSGQYSIDVSYPQYNDQGVGQSHRDEGIAVIQVSLDYLVWVYLSALMLVVISSGATILIQCLVKELSG